MNNKKRNHFYKKPNGFFNIRDKISKFGTRNIISSKKGDFGDFGMIAKIAFVGIAFVIILFVFFGKGQLFSKSTKPIDATASGLTADCDNDGKVNTLDPCPCEPNVDECKVSVNECNKRKDDVGANKKTNCLS